MGQQHLPNISIFILKLIWSKSWLLQSMLHTIYYTNNVPNDIKHRSPQNSNNVYLSAQVNTLQDNNIVDNKTLN